MPYQPLILVIEDDARIRRFIVAGLSSQSYRVIEADRAATGLSLAGSHAPDIILLDLGLPDRDGVEIIRALRAWTQTPIIVVSARGHERSKVVALDAGADDYLTKPFGVAERTVLVGGEPVHLTRTEYRIMTILVRHAGKVVTHQHLLTEVWGPGRSEETQYVRVFMANLRRKLEPDPARPRYLLTEVGVGYRLLDE